VHKINTNYTGVRDMKLHKSGEGIAIVACITSEASAFAGSVVTFAPAATLETVIIGELNFCGVGAVMIVSRLKVKASNLWCASSCAFVVFDDDKMLGSLDRVSSEGNIDCNGAS